MRKKPWEALLLLAFVAVWQWAAPRTELPTPCPPEVRAQHEALSRNLRRTRQWEVWGERYGARGGWVVVRYTVDRGGALRDVELVSQHGDADLVLAGVKACAPVPPLPDGVRSLEVVELFWDEGQAELGPGTLEAALQALHEDGRWIRLR